MAHNSNNSDGMSVEDLIVALQQRDQGALQVLYEQYSGALYGIIVRIVQSTEIAEDVLQEVFVRIWNNVSSYDNSRGRLFTWMLNIARNAALDKIKSREYKDLKRNRSIDFVVDELDGQLSEPDKTDYIGLRDLVRDLKPEQRDIVDLIYFQGYTQSEAAQELQIPLGTVKTRLRIAINYFRKTITTKR